jgi:O-antigen ligase
MLLALKQRYVDHHVQCAGPFTHQNGFGMVANLIYAPAFAVSLAGQGGRFAVSVVVAAAIVVVLSLSRGALIMFGVAGALVFLGSCGRRLTAFKVRMLLGSLAAAAALILKSIDTILERFATARDASEEARVLFKAAASRMLADHPLGVGINQYSYCLENLGYADALGIPLIDRGGIVHNIYWLTAAELGYAGFAAFVLLIGTPLALALRGALRDPGIRGDALLGLSAGLVVTYLQLTLEWAFRITPVAQSIWIVWGMIAGLSLRSRLAARPEAAS